MSHWSNKKLFILDKYQVEENLFSITRSIFQLISAGFCYCVLRSNAYKNMCKCFFDVVFDVDFFIFYHYCITSFNKVSTPRGVSEICDGENLWQWSQLETRRKRLSSVNHFAKTIHHHHHKNVETWFLEVCRNKVLSCFS